MNDSFKNSINKYMRFCKKENWIENEAYKFVFANYVNCNVDWDTNSDLKILKTLKQSQKIKYTTGVKGVQFIQKSGRFSLKDFISLNDIKLLREFKNKDFEQIDWSERTMSFTALSAWLSSLFPEKFYPIPMIGYDQTIMFLFNYEKKKFPKAGQKYLLECQSFMEDTWNNMSQYPIEDLCLIEWNKFYKDNPRLNIPIKKELALIDKVWLAQDFHLFVYKQILELYEPKNKEIQVAEDKEPIAIEGNTVLAKHMRYERNSAFIQKIKKEAIAKNKMLNCQICGFSFFEKYGEIGEGFIEAHHKKPFSENNGETKTKREDIALVCSNCHRMLHRGTPTFAIEEIKQRIK